MTQEELNRELLKSAALCKIYGIEIFLAKGADIQSVDEKGNTALHLVSQEGHSGCTRFLIDKGANPKAINMYGSTPLHFAAFYNHLDVVQILVYYGADPLIMATSGETPLSLAKSEETKKPIADFLEMVAEQIKLDRMIHSEAENNQLTVVF